MNYTGVGLIIQDYDKKYLLHLRDGNTNKMSNEWCLVGGSREDNEDILTTAVREAKEETGLTLTSPTVLGNFMYRDKEIALIIGAVDTRVESIVLGEGSELKLFSGEEVLRLQESLDYSNPFLAQLERYIKNDLDNKIFNLQ